MTSILLSWSHRGRLSIILLTGYPLLYLLFFAKLSLNFNFVKSLAEIALKSIHPTTHPTHPTEKV